MNKNTGTISDNDRNALERLEFYAGQQRIHDGHAQNCPRCGRPAIKPRLRTNALARLRKPDIYICDACGTSEGLESVPGSPKKQLSEWAAVRDPDWRCLP